MRTTVTLAATAAALVVGTLLLSACGTAPATSGGPALPSLPTSPVADQPVASTPATAGATTTGTAITGSAPVTAPAPVPTAPAPTATPTPTRPEPMFATPEAAMAYMAVAFDTGDLTALRKVTTPESRKELYDMWPDPVHLRLSRCDKESGGSSYVCYFPHDPPKGMDPSSVPEATMVVEPAARPGWYMSELAECG
jgi:hypothetical protein